MNIELEPGRYVVAVSGGVDSVVLLDCLAKQYASSVVSRQSSVQTENRPQTTDLRSQISDAAGQSKIQDPRSKIQLIVAHFDHGIRPDSAEDRRFAEKLARKVGLPFVYDEGRLGPDASEAAARDARYAFLHRVREASGARAIITAHHQDDVLETAILNVIRGTSRRGLTALKSTGTLIRPLLHAPKQELAAYAKKHNLAWREDPTNQETQYLRNYVRHRVLPCFTAQDRQKLLDIIEHLHAVNRQIDQELPRIVIGSTSHMERMAFIMLPHAVAREALAYWLRQSGIRGYDKKILERLVVAAKTYKPGRVTDINKDWQLAVGQHDLVIKYRSR